MRYQLRPFVNFGYDVRVVNDVAAASRTVRLVLICCVVATAVSCGQSGNERSAAEIAGSSTAPASVTEPTSKNGDAAALVLSREEGQPVLAGEAEQRLYSSTDREADIIARMVSRNVSYSDFLRYANVLAHPQPTESPEVWLTIANNPDRDHRIRTIALFLFFKRHVATPITIHDLYHNDPYQKVMPSMTHALVLGGRPLAFFASGNSIPNGVLILDNDYLIASHANVLLAVSGESIWREDIDTLLSNTSGLEKRYMCTEVALVMDGSRWPSVEEE